jgi:gluconolactonase
MRACAVLLLLSACDGAGDPGADAGLSDSAVDGGQDAAMDSGITIDSGTTEDSGSNDRVPATTFCECSRSMPLPNAGAFMGCATMRPDGVGTYYEAPPYSRGPDADTRVGVPVGVVTQGSLGPNTIYPTVTHDYWVYVPAQYDGSSPAALLVLTDGEVYVQNDESAPYRTPTVLDNLIDEGAMPVTIAVFVSPGFTDQGVENRSIEYDTPDDTFARFVHEELLPAATGGYSITTDPTLRAIGGRSSGAVAAWGVVWWRTDSFALAYTTVGSFVRLLANPSGEFAEVYPMWVESMPRKPIRVTLLSGINDLENEYGNWRDAHMAMTTALDCAGYSYRSGFGETAHEDGTHLAAKFGEDMRWLWSAAAR